ncbi:DNA polymerase III subunit gamma/tau [Gracilibacillus caseinilyticus]|uniref:DNA-directed DNA polymerase n=1 Tax=Gracilibacillus caseinilyticus TaxID=2932256 RepID=A0ABY4F027_9BACI|nr:DNA polymerase III subunit gamma/tau [Gracilibacillus caseinilyticus]UOQ49550.1 DNA polymerase III subunit gamma/tau [Gracilibacillus caseinilyticus]
MGYQALYRVWRPKNFEDVVGQVHITRTLQNAVMQDKFTHAYLFSGPRGTGKTSAAKIFAKAVNCQNGPALEPCNACDACIGIQDGSISDVVEIDAASNNGVEQIRDIRDKVKYAPSAVTYKVYIIDEVHMLSIGAFNALLKTLEEPPKHVIFVLATTEPHKIPLTIISRCQRFDFKRIAQSAMVERMKKIIAAENISVTDEALEGVALSAEGGMRDALSLLDQAISYSEEQVTIDDVLAVTGSVSQAKLAKIVNTMHENEVKESLLEIDAMIQEGKDPGRFVFDLIYYLRDILLYQTASSLENVLERAIVDDAFQSLAQSLDSQWIQGAIKELNLCQQEIKWTNSPKVFIEVAVLKICNQSNSTQTNVASLPEVEKLQEKLTKLEQQLSQLQKQPVQQQQETQQQAPKRNASVGRNSYKVPYDRIRNVLNGASKEAIKKIRAQWPSFMDALKKQSAPAHATIQNSKPSAASEDVVVIAFRYEIHCSLALEHKQTIELMLSESTGQNITFIPIPESEWASLREEYVRKQKAQGEESGEQDESSVQTEGDPLVDNARKLVGDDLLEIRD